MADNTPAPRARVLCVAGTHSGGAAGLEMDQRVLALLGVYAMTAATSVNAQSTRGCHRTHPLPPDLVADQMDAVLGDIGADAVKTGQMATAETVQVVAGRLRHYGVKRLVVDPVLASTSGSPLLGPGGQEALVAQIFPLATVVTPNVPEAERLLGRPIPDAHAARAAVRDLQALGPGAIVLKGGHLPGAPLDLLYDGQGFVEFPGERFPTPHTGGGGCAFATALAAHLALGETLATAVGAAKALVAQAIQGAVALGAGRSPVNPWAFKT